MIRSLLLITGASFVLAVACFAGAAALGGQDLFRGGWPHGGRWSFNDHDGHWRRDHYGPSLPGDSATTTREIAWTGGDRLELSAPVDVQFTQAPGPGKLVITGPKDLVDRVELDGGELGLQGGDWGSDGRVSVVMTAPAVSRFTIDGDESLTVAGYDQDRLDVDVSGNGTAKVAGKARAVDIDISGSGNVDLGGVAASSAQADISGSGRAAIAASDEASLDISGSGEVDLLTHPAKLNSDVSGSGRIVESTPAAAQPPASPAQPKPR